MKKGKKGNRRGPAVRIDWREVDSREKRGKGCPEGHLPVSVYIASCPHLSAHKFARRGVPLQHEVGGAAPNKARSSESPRLGRISFSGSRAVSEFIAGHRRGI